MKAGKEGPMRKNFPSAFRKDKAKASQTKTNVKTGETTVDPNPGFKKDDLMFRRPKNADGTPYTDEQMKKLRKKSLDRLYSDMKIKSYGKGKNPIML